MSRHRVRLLIRVQVEWDDGDRLISDMDRHYAVSILRRNLPSWELGRYLENERLSYFFERARVDGAYMKNIFDNKSALIMRIVATIIVSGTSDDIAFLVLNLPPDIRLDHI